MTAEFLFAPVTADVNPLLGLGLFGLVAGVGLPLLVVTLVKNFDKQQDGFTPKNPVRRQQPPLAA